MYVFADLQCHANSDSDGCSFTRALAFKVGMHAQSYKTNILNFMKLIRIRQAH